MTTTPRPGNGNNAQIFFGEARSDRTAYFSIPVEWLGTLGRRTEVLLFLEMVHAARTSYGRLEAARQTGFGDNERVVMAITITNIYRSEKDKAVLADHCEIRYGT